MTLGPLHGPGDNLEYGASFVVVTVGIERRSFGPFGRFDIYTASETELTLFSPGCHYQATYTLMTPWRYRRPWRVPDARAPGLIDPRLGTNNAY
jgi:hypothetical protein